MGKVGSLKDYYLFKKLKTKRSSPPLKTCNEIKFHERQIKRKRYKRALSIVDPLWPAQWHLKKGKFSFDTLPLWEKGIMGQGITIAIVDDGLEASMSFPFF